jgi:hypothetical protein
MATWQYDFVVVPREELSSAVGASIAKLSLEQFKTLKFWTTTQPVADYGAVFKQWRPELKSWSSDLKMWGAEESNRIDVYSRAGRVFHIGFRVELRSLSIRFIELLASFARQSNCVLVSAHSLGVVEPLRETILSHLFKSSGVNNVWDWLSGTKESKLKAPLPQVFLSHSSADKSFVTRLAVDLRSKDIPVWFDRWELKVGDSLSSKIADGINESGWLAVVLSKQSVSSSWVKKELNAALARELQEKNVFVLPIIMEDCDIPLFLLDKVYADFKESYQHGLDVLLKRLLEGD